MIGWLLLYVLFLIMLSIVCWTLKNGISPMPTSPKVRTELLKWVPPLSGGKIYELGSGWGTLAFALAKEFPGCHVHAYETSWIPYFYSIWKKKFLNVPNLTFHRRDLFTVSLQDASLIVCYLYPGVMQKLQLKFSKELLPSAIVISHTFALPNWEPFQTIEVKDIYKTRIYVYKMNN